MGVDPPPADDRPVAHDIEAVEEVDDGADVVRDRDDDPLMQGSLSPALEEYRGERVKLVRLERLEREEQLVPRDKVRAALGRVATVLR